MERTTSLANLIVLVFGLGVFTTPGFAQDPVKEPAPHVLSDDSDCIDCHGPLMEGKAVHEPVEEEMCEACHEQPDESLHVFDTPENQTAICMSCHDSVAGPVEHKPVTEGHCTACHEPHHSEFKSLLRNDEEGDLCATCHQDYPALEAEYIHGPVDAGMCTICHLPHASEQPKLLNEEPITLCLGCHEDLEEEMDEAENVHLPVEEDCGLCHDPHSGPIEFQLRQEGALLCFDCHDGIRESTEKSIDHAVVKDERACMNCHQPHHSAYPAMLNDSPKDVCMSCHDAEIEVDEDTKITAMGPLLSMEFTHGPIQEGNCSACHDPHGSDVFSILRDSYPRKFYAKWDPEMYSLCFRCHEESIFTDDKTETLTNFRNGETNLHYMHVNRAKKGRTCRACHEVHASSYPVHLAEAVPFGAWDMPINFEVTPNGGSCSPGCHDPQAYDREQAIEPAPKVPVEPVITPEVPEDVPPAEKPEEVPPAEKPEE